MPCSKPEDRGGARGGILLAGQGQQLGEIGLIGGALLGERGDRR